MQENNSGCFFLTSVYIQMPFKKPIQTHTEWLTRPEVDRVGLRPVTVYTRVTPGRRVHDQTHTEWLTRPEVDRVGLRPVTVYTRVTPGRRVHDQTHTEWLTRPEVDRVGLRPVTVYTRVTPGRRVHEAGVGTVVQRSG